MTDNSPDLACPEWDERIIEAALAPGSDAQLEQHLKTCAPCQASHAQTLRTSEALHDAFELDAGHALTQLDAPAILTALPPKRPRVRRFSLIAAAFAITATAALTWALADDGTAPRSPIGPGGAAQAEAHPSYPVWTGVYDTADGPITLNTGISQVRCKQGRFRLSVQTHKLLDSTTPQDANMNNSRSTWTVVTLTVLAGTVLWIDDDGQQTLQAGQSIRARSLDAPGKTSTRDMGPRAAPSITTDPFVSSGGSSRQSVEIEPTRTLRVRWSDGSVVQGSLDVVDDHGETLDLFDLDDRGIARLPDFESPAYLVVQPKNAAPTRHVLHPTGDQEIVLDKGLSFTGTARTLGGQTLAGVRFWLFVEADSTRPELPELNPDPEVVTDHEGRFAVHGLSRTWAAKLQCEHAYEIHDSSRGAYQGTAFVTPTEDYDLVLKYRPQLRGRVLLSDGSTPAGGAQIEVVTGRFRADAAYYITADESGTFAVRVEGTPFKSLTLKISPEHGGQPRSVPVLGELSSDRDLGDILLAPEAALQLRILDQNGQPVPHARARAGPKGSISAPSDYSGLTTLAVREHDTQVHVAVAGMSPDVFDLPRPLPETLSIELKPSNQLTVLLKRGESEIPIAKTKLRIQWRGELFQTGPPGVASLLGQSREIISFRNQSGGRTSNWIVDFDKHGRAVLSHLKPGVEFAVDLIDQFGNLIDSRDLQLGEIDDRRIEFVITGEPRGIQLSVRGPDSRVLSNASVEIAVSRNRISWTQCDYRGEVELNDIFAESIDLKVSCPGFISRSFSNLPVSPTPSRVEVHLEPGKEIEIEVSDASGNRCPDFALEITEIGTNGVDPMGPITVVGSNPYGKVILKNLPKKAIQITAHIASNTVKVRVEANEDRAQVRLPVTLGAADLKIPSRLRNKDLQVVIHSLDHQSEESHFFEPNALSPDGTLHVLNLPDGRSRAFVYALGERRSPEGLPTSPLQSESDFEIRGGQVTTVTLIP